MDPTQVAAALWRESVAGAALPTDPLDGAAVPAAQATQAMLGNRINGSEKSEGSTPVAQSPEITL